ncbi:hypothetical protein B0T14DRAFT_309267 [Immersiella caudata]|uniref:Uncharacterized protein n=1 Tax=Immersiella caudata TaxID=314043 RepID=A0AA40BUT0_9PEZI|nr:hypothetical protein B0T14DRAFT_309267 [Immersiella caudata]
MGWVGEAWVCIGDDRCDYDIGEIPEILCFEHDHTSLRVQRIREKPAPYDEASSSPGWKGGDDQEVQLEDIETRHLELFPKLGGIPEGHIVFFWTSSAFFTLTATEDKHPSRGTAIFDSFGEVVGNMGPVSSKTPAQGQEQHESIVVGSRRNQFSPPSLLVLQVEWRESIAYRVDVGEILEEAWERASHTWKLVPLG